MGEDKGEGVKTSGEKSYDLTPPKPSDEGKSQVRYDSEKQEKANLPKVPNTGVSSYPKQNGIPASPSVIPPSLMKAGIQSVAEQHLVNQLKEYENIVKNKDLTQKQTQNLLDEYKKLLYTQPKEITSHPPTFNEGGDLALTRQQELALESLSRLINDEKLQKEKPELVYSEIIQNLLVPKMDDAAKNLDLPTYSRAIEPLRYVHDYIDPKDPSKNVVISEIDHEQFKKRDSDLNDKITELMDQMDESIIDGVSSDLKGTVEKLEKAADFMANNMLITAKLRRKPAFELLARFKNEKGNLTDQERFASVQVLSELLKEGKIYLGPKEKKEMIAFVEKYMAQFEGKNSSEITKSEEKDCPDKKTLEEDIEKLENTRKDLQAVAFQLETSPNKTPSEIERLAKFKDIIQKVHAKLTENLDKFPKDSQTYRLTQRAICATNTIFDCLKETESSITAPTGTRREEISEENIQKSSTDNFSDLLNK